MGVVAALAEKGDQHAVARVSPRFRVDAGMNIIRCSCGKMPKMELACFRTRCANYTSEHVLPRPNSDHHHHHPQHIIISVAICWLKRLGYFWDSS